MTHRRCLRGADFSQSWAPQINPGPGRGLSRFYSKERNMTEHQGLWSRRVGLLLVAALLALAPGPANGQSRSAYARMERETLVKELGLTPEKATAFQAVGDKFDQTRAGIIAGIKSKEGARDNAMAAA